MTTLSARRASAQFQNPRPPRSARSAILRRLRTDVPLVVSLVVVAVFVACALGAQFIAPFDPNSQDVLNRLIPPLNVGDGRSFLGTDPLGRDILSRMIYGARVSLLVATTAVAIAGTIGVTLGILAGYYGGRLEVVIMRLADIQFSIPFITLALAMVAVVGAGLINIIVVLGVTGWVVYARMVRAEVLSIKSREYVEAARTLGASNMRLMLRHILPNAWGAAAVVATIEVARMIITEASLSFLGLGVPSSVPTWGGMVADGRNYLASAWWVSALPGLAILVTVIAINIIGDWLGDMANPSLRDW